MWGETSTSTLSIWAKDRDNEQVIWRLIGSSDSLIVKVQLIRYQQFTIIINAWLKERQPISVNSNLIQSQSPRVRVAHHVAPQWSSIIGIRRSSSLAAKSQPIKKFFQLSQQQDVSTFPSVIQNIMDHIVFLSNFKEIKQLFSLRNNNLHCLFHHNILQIQ